MAFKIGRVVLGEIAPGSGNAPLDRSLIWLQLAHQKLEHDRLGQLVLADKGDLLVAAGDEADVVEELDAVHRLADVCDKEDVLADLAVAGKAHKRIAAGGGGDLLQADLVEQLAAGRRLLALGFVRGEAGDKGLQLGDLFLVALVLVAHQSLDELRRLVPEVVVADIHLDLAVVDVHDVGADRIQEVAVVGDDDDGALVVEQKVLEPVDGFDVQVVGRLVEHDDVGVSEERLGQKDLDLIARVGVGHPVVVLADVDPEALEDPAGVRLRFPSVHLGKLRLELGGQDPVFVREVLFFIDGVLLLHDVVEVLVAHDDGVHDRIGVVLELILLQDGHPDAWLHRHIAAGGLELSGEDAQEGGLARAVGADDAVAVARRELQVRMLKEDGTGKLHTEVGYCNHILTPCSTEAASAPDLKDSDCAQG